MILTVVLVVAMPFLSAMSQKAQHVAELAKYAKATEPIFVRSEYPGDQKVFARAERIKELLAESGNQWSIPVFALYYADAGNWGETKEQFEARCRAFEIKEMNAWAKKLKRENEDAYTTHFLRQAQ